MSPLESTTGLVIDPIDAIEEDEGQTSGDFNQERKIMGSTAQIWTLNFDAISVQILLIPSAVTIFAPIVHERSQFIPKDISA